MTNLEKSREALKKQYPEDAKIDNADAKYLIHRYLLSPSKRNKFASYMEGVSRICECCANCKICNADPFSIFSDDYQQRHLCYTGLMEWMESAEIKK